MIRLGILMAVTIAALLGVMAIYGDGNPRTERAEKAPEQKRSAATDAGAPSLSATPAGTSSATNQVPAAEVVKVSTQTPERTQRFPGPALMPSPEYAGRTPEAPEAPPSGARGPILYVTATRVNFRAGPSTSDPVIGALNNGAAVEALGPADASWVNIRDANGRIGYMSGQFLSSEAPG